MDEEEETIRGLGLFRNWRRNVYSKQKRMRWTLGAISQRRHRLDMMMTSLSPLSLRATVREPLGLLTYCSVKLPRRDHWSVKTWKYGVGVGASWAGRLSVPLTATDADLMVTDCFDGQGCSLISGADAENSALGPSPITAFHTTVQPVRSIAAEGEG